MYNFFVCFGATPGSFRAFSWQCLRDHIGCREWSLGGLCARQVPSPLFYLFDPKMYNYLKTSFDNGTGS